MLRMSTLFAASMVFTGICSAFAAEGDAALGLWVTQDGKGRIEVFKEKDTYAAKIVWLKEPNYNEDEEDTGKPRVDKNNPDKKKRTRPILGLKMMEKFKYAGKNVFTKGKIYDPEEGKTYSCKMTLDKDTLHVRGYIGISLIGRTTTWKRYVPEKEEVKKE